MEPERKDENAALAKPGDPAVPAWLSLLTRLPLPVLHGLASLAAVLGPVVAPRRFRTIQDNLAAAFPGLDPKARRRLAHAAVRNLIDVVAETFKALSIPRASLDARVKITNPELLDRFREAGQSIIVLGSHQANWEWVLLSCSSQLPFEVQCAYKPPHGPRLAAFLLAMRTRFGARLFTPAEAKQTIIEGRRTLRAIVITPDEKPAGGEPSRSAAFLGGETEFRSSFEQIALLWRYPVVFAARRRVARGRYEVTFQLLGEPPYDPAACNLVEAYAAALQDSIAANPADWLWSRRRRQAAPAFYR